MIKIGDKVKYIGSVYVNLIGKIGIVHNFDERGNAILYFPDLEEGFDVGRGGIKLWSTCKGGERRYLLIGKKNLEKVQGDDNMIKVGSVIQYDGAFYDLLWGENGVVEKIEGKEALIHYPDLEEGQHIGDGFVLHDNHGEYYSDNYIWLELKDLILVNNGGDDKMFKVGDLVEYIGNGLRGIYKGDRTGTVIAIEEDRSVVNICFNGSRFTWWCVKDNLRKIDNKNGGDSMRKILVIGNTGNYETGAKKGDILDVTSEAFGYVVTERGRVKDIDYVEYKEGEMIAHINDLRDCFKAGLRFTDENNLVYPDGKIALKAENLQYLDRTFKVKRFKANQFVIGNEKVEICFGKSEIGTIVEFRR